MNPNTPDPGAPVPNRQGEHRLGEGDPAEAGEIATGDRREDVHFEPDANQLVVAHYLERPQAPLPPDVQPADTAAPAPADAPPVEDVRTAPEGSSVWDARPPAEDGEPEGGHQTGA